MSAPVFSVLASWLSHDSQVRGLQNTVTERVHKMSHDEAGKAWLSEIQKQHGSFLGLKPLVFFVGLGGYEEPTFWQMFFLYGGTPMDLVVTEKSLLFCDPDFGIGSKITTVPRNTVRGAKTDWNSGHMLIVTTDSGVIKCDTGRRLDAKPIASMIEQWRIN